LTRKPKHVIFDCDGVLINSEILANRVDAEVKTRLGFPITLEEQILKFVGQGSGNPVMVEEFRRLPKDYLQLLKSELAKVYESELRAHDGVAELLKNFPLPKCVASSSELNSLKRKLKFTELDRYFAPEAVFSGHMVERSKPEPHLFWLAAEKMGWAAEDCLVIEDSVAGVTAGKAAGMTVCAFVGGEHILPGYTDQLLKAGADFVVPKISNILRLL
jgi:HAD superfamily hydrolase (TIGR01509 family)